MPKLLLSVFIALVLSATSNAQPKTIMHRAKDTTKDASGWYYAKSTEGNFSALVPMPFNDYTIKDDNPKEKLLGYGIGGKNQEGLMFTVFKGQKVTQGMPLEEIPKSFSPDSNAISNVKKEKYMNHNSIYFELVNNDGVIFVRIVELENAFGIMQTIQGAGGSKKVVEKYAGRFFSSLKISE